MLPWAVLAWAGGGVPWPEGARPVTEVIHPAYVRGEFAGDSGPYWLELSPGDGGFCRGGGIALAVRRDLDARSESFELDDVPPPVSATCAALVNMAPSVREAMAEARALAEAEAAKRPGPDGVPDVPQPAPAQVPAAGGADDRAIARWTPRPFHALVLPWLLAAGWWARRAGRWWMLPVMALALAVRLRFPETVVLGGDAAYERLQTALGRGSIDRYYGETWPSLLGLFGRAGQAAGLDVTALVHPFNLFASVATVGVLGVLGERLRLSLPRAPVVLAVLGAVAAWPVALARTEDHVVLGAFLQLLAFAAGLGKTPLDRATCALTLVLLGHLRPEMLAPAGVMCLLLWGAWPYLVVALVGLAARLAYLPRVEGGPPIDWGRLVDPGAWPQMAEVYGLLPAVPLMLLSLGARSRVAQLGLLVNLLLYLPKTQPAADPLRFGLLPQAWLLVAALDGASRLMFHVEHRARWLVLLPFVAVFFQPPSTRPWAWEAEYQFLRQALPRGDGLDAELSEAVISGWYDGAQDPHGAMGHWMSLRTAMPWRKLGTGTPSPGDYLFRGTADHLGGAWVGGAWGLDVVTEREAAPSSDGWVDFGAEPVRLGLYRVREAGQPLSPE